MRGETSRGVHNRGTKTGISAHQREVEKNDGVGGVHSSKRLSAGAGMLGKRNMRPLGCCQRNWKELGET